MCPAECFENGWVADSNDAWPVRKVLFDLGILVFVWLAASSRSLKSDLDWLFLSLRLVGSGSVSPPGARGEQQHVRPDAVSPQRQGSQAFPPHLQPEVPCASVSGRGRQGALLAVFCWCKMATFPTPPLRNPMKNGGHTESSSDGNPHTRGLPHRRISDLLEMWSQPVYLRCMGVRGQHVLRHVAFGDGWRIPSTILRNHQNPVQLAGPSAVSYWPSSFTLESEELSKAFQSVPGDGRYSPVFRIGYRVKGDTQS